MPIYEYKCLKCNYLFEVSHKISDNIEYCGLHCPIQEIGKVKKIMSGFNVRFKGSGFYETDYKRRNKK